MKIITQLIERIKDLPFVKNGQLIEKGQAFLKRLSALSELPIVDLRKIDKLLNWTIGWVIVGFCVVAILFFAGNTAVLWICIAFLIVLLVLHNFMLLKSRGEEKKLTERANQLSTLQEMSLSLSSTLNLNQVAELIPHSCVRLSHADGCVLSLVEKTKGEMRIKVTYGIQTPEQDLEAEDEINNLVLRRKKSLSILDLAVERKTPLWAKREGFKSYLGFPLIIRDEIVGVVSLYTKQKRAFSLEEEEMLNIFAAQAATALENARLYSVTKEAMQKEITAAMALYKIEKAIANNRPELEEQLNLIMEGSLQITQSEKASIWLVDELSSEVVCRGVYPMEEKLIEARVKLGEGVTGWVAKEGIMQNISNLSEDKRFINILNQDLRSQLSVPLRYKDKTIGVLNIFNKIDEEMFTKADEKIQTVLSAHAALALQTSSLYQELRNAASALSILYEISKTISEGQDLQRVLTLILKRSTEIFKAQNGSIMLLDEDTNELTIKVALGLSDEIIASTRKKPGDGSIVGWVTKEQEPLLLIGRVKDARFTTHKEGEIKDAMCAPIKIKNRLVGVLNVSNRHGEGIFSESDLNLLCTLANETGMVIETAQLYEMTTKKVTELSSFYVISKSLSATLNLQMVLKSIMERILLLFPQLAVTICLLDTKKQDLKRIAGLDFEERMIGEEEIELKGELKDALEPLLSRSRYLAFSRVERIHPHLKPLIGKGEIDYLYIFPLESKGRLIGILSLASQDEFKLSKENIRLLTAIFQATATAIDNASLYEQTKRRVEELIGVQEVASQMLLSKDSQEIMALIVSVVNDVIHSDLGLLYLWDDDRKEFGVKVGQGRRRLSEATFKSLRFKMGEGSVGWVGENQQPLILDEPRDDMRFKPLVDITIKNLISVPIIRNGVVIGVMEFINKQTEKGFNEDDLRMITIMAHQVGIVLENTGSFEEIKRRALQLSAVHAVNKIISSILSMEEVLPQLIELTSKVMRVRKASLMFVDEEKKILKIHASYGLTFMEQEREGELKLGEGIAGRVFLSNKPLIINNLSEDTTLSAEEKNLYLEKSYLCIPLVIRKRLSGVISLSSKLLDTPFNEQDLELLSTMAEQMGMVIEYAQLYASLQRYSLDTIKAISVILETHNPLTKGHSDEVAKYAVAIGKEMHLSREEIRNLEIAGLVHDIGNIGIKESILLKPEKELSVEEHRQIRNHPFIGAQILKPLGFMREIVPIVYTHHERYDGDGYLDGLKGEEIPLAARILAVADSFEMMTSEKGFRESLDDDEAVEVLKQESGKHFDPQVVKAFLKIHPVLRKEQLERIRVRRHEKKRGEKEIGSGQRVWDRYA